MPIHFHKQHWLGALLATVSLSVILVLAISPQAQGAGPTSAEYGVVLNLAGKQRMLTQKMSKEIMLVALEIETAKNLESLGNTSALFDKTLKGLREGSADLGLPATSSERILRQLDKIDAIWAEFGPVVQDVLGSGGATQEQVASIAEKNLPLLKAMNKAVGLYEKDAIKGGLKASPDLATTINLAGKQRMLTQKMSKEFLLVAYGHQVEDSKLSLLETYSLFERTLNGLLDGDEVLGLPGTKARPTREQLAVVNGLWQDFKPVVAYGADHGTSSIATDKITALAATNIPLLREMNKAVGMYEKAAAE